MSLANWVQTILATALVLVTGTLAWITWRYVRLTGAIVSQGEDRARRDQDNNETRRRRTALTLAAEAQHLQQLLPRPSDGVLAPGLTYEHLRQAALQVSLLALDVGGGTEQTAFAVGDHLEEWNLHNSARAQDDELGAVAGVNAQVAANEAHRLLENVITKAAEVARST